MGCTLVMERGNRAAELGNSGFYWRRGGGVFLVCAAHFWLTFGLGLSISDTGVSWGYTVGGWGVAG